MRTLRLLGIGLAALAAPASLAWGQSAPGDVGDLVGARAASAEARLSSRGYTNAGSEAGDDRRWTYWWNARRNVCLSVVTMNGQIGAITATPAPDCQRGRPTTLPGPVGPPVDTGRPTTLPGPAGPPVDAGRPATLPGPTGPAVVSGRVEQLRFERGATSATRRGQIKGYETMTYLVDLRAGQPLAVTLQTSNPSSYFNVTAPGANQALFIGSTSGPRYQGRAPVSGRYKIDIYLMRNAARRGEAARYTLDVSARR